VIVTSKTFYIGSTNDIFKPVVIAVENRKFFATIEFIMAGIKVMLKAYMMN